MEDFVKRFGKDGQRIRAKVAHTLKNAEKLSQAEIDSVWNDAMAFMKTLPDKKRGAFYWNSGGLECLFLLTTESKEAP
ncbi:MAG: hypothetical protein SR1Q7_06610 [Quinella sp. 1Q7]|nr:hypothetical protein [Quinella sp. 1Q7]